MHNLVARDAAVGMQIRGPIAAQIRRLPEDSRIRLRLAE
jgi:hypothetical protein